MTDDTPTKDPRPSDRACMDPTLPYFGTRAEVYRGKARYTKGFLTQADLTKNKKGRVVSKRAARQRTQTAMTLGQVLEFIEGHKGQFTVVGRSTSTI